MFRYKNILPKYKIRIEFYISKMAKLLDNFSWYLQSRRKRLAILEVVISFGYFGERIMDKSIQ